MTTSKDSYFHGIVEGEEVEDTWQVLHEHFEKLAKEDNAKDNRSGAGNIDGR